MKANVDIVFKAYDENQMFVLVKKGTNNLYMDLGVCQLINEMEYWDLPLKSAEMQGEYGYIFSKDIDVEHMKMEIERFIVHNNI